MSSIPSVSLQSLVSNDSEVITNLENNLDKNQDYFDKILEHLKK